LEILKQPTKETILNTLKQLKLETENTIGNIKKSIQKSDSTTRTCIKHLLKAKLVRKELKQKVKRGNKTYKFHCLVKKRSGYCYFLTEKGLELRNELLFVKQLLKETK